MIRQAAFDHQIIIPLGIILFPTRDFFAHKLEIVSPAGFLPTWK
jgi:hypothetical protein